MPVTSDHSKSSAPRPRSLRQQVRRATCVALPLFAALSACSGSNESSKVAGGAASSSTSAGSADIIVPSSDGGSANGSGGSGTGSTPGPYMLPAGYMMTEKGGYKDLGPDTGTSAAGTTGAAGAASSGSGCGTQIIGVVRDFKGINEPMGHPDFEHFSGGGPSKGIVKPDLGTDQKPVYAANGAFMDPVNGQQTTSKADYDQWYRNTQDVNKPFLVSFYFEPNNKVLTFQSITFFPIDGVGWGNSCHEANADPKTCTPQAHNFGFTTEIHTRFNYMGGETFAFTGDDDLWVFINNKLAIDLGGLHPQASDMISLDASAKELGITVGQAYNLDLFHAERHTDASDFRVDTNLQFTNCVTIIPDVPVK
jgi:fibro-slime domain-containing protein